MADRGFRCGLATIAGRPNVGKSTLINQMVGTKLSITSNRPQTTRHRILGIATSGSSQLIFVDTPGIHPGRARTLNRYMNRIATKALADVDLVVMVAEASGWTPGDDPILDRIAVETAPAVLVLNKIDRVRRREGILPVLDDAAGRYAFEAIIPVSARTGENLDRLASVVESSMPVSPAMFPQGQVTDRSVAFLVSEIVREKLIRRLGQELPHRLAVVTERFQEERGRTVVNVLVWVERRPHKAIVIGRRGERLKEAGTASRREISRLLGRPVHLEIWVKVREGWTDDERALRGLGFSE